MSSPRRKIDREKFSSDGSGHGEEDEEEEEEEEEEVDDDSLTEEDASSAMRSIFASYYGIEESVGQQKKSAADLIDTAHFDAESFVRELLETTPVEELLSKDTRMVHEIRTLDSDMQMLVYENYNKFISATETIKRMKR